MFKSQGTVASTRLQRHTDDQKWSEIKQDLHRRLVHGVDHAALRDMDETQLRTELRKGAEELCRSRPDLLSLTERRKLIDELVDEVLGLGPLEQLLKDRTISDILINGPKLIYVERHGKLEATDTTFASEQHLLTTLQRILSRVGRRIDESSPMVDARLPDGSRVNAIIKPLAIDGALISIRRRPAEAMTGDALVAGGAISPEMLKFLAASVQSRANVLISGGTGSGKTTLLNVLSSYIPADQRVVTIEDAAELSLNQPHVARLETRPANLEGAGEITTRELVKNALRMRPDRVIVGECRGGEAFDMLQAMNTGHDGSLTTLHANSANDAVSRLQMLVGMCGIDLPMRHIDRQIASAIHLVVHVARLEGGARRVVQVAELAGVEDGQIVLQDIYRFNQTGIDERGLAQGTFDSTGVVPRSLVRMRSRGIALDERQFAAEQIAVLDKNQAKS